MTLQVSQPPWGRAALQGRSGLRVQACGGVCTSVQRGSSRSGTTSPRPRPVTTAARTPTCLGASAETASTSAPRRPSESNATAGTRGTSAGGGVGSRRPGIGAVTGSTSGGGSRIAAPDAVLPPHSPPGRGCCPGSSALSQQPGRGRERPATVTTGLWGGETPPESPTTGPGPFVLSYQTGPRVTLTLPAGPPAPPPAPGVTRALSPTRSRVIVPLGGRAPFPHRRLRGPGHPTGQVGGRPQSLAYSFHRRLRPN